MVDLKDPNMPNYKTVLLKLSGEALMGNSSYGIDPELIAYLAEEIKTVHQTGIRIAIVIGGGNIFRGIQSGGEAGIDRTTADSMGMLATVINSLALQNSLEKIGLAVRLQTALAIATVGEPFHKRQAMRHLEQGRIVIFAAGTGNPFFTTDSAAALRALEIQADLLIKGTKVDGVYDRDPKKFSDAVKYNQLSYSEMLEKKLHIMDMTAITLCMDNKMPIHVYNLFAKGALMDVLTGKQIGTLVNL